MTQYLPFTDVIGSNICNDETGDGEQAKFELFWSGIVYLRHGWFLRYHQNSSSPLGNLRICNYLSWRSSPSWRTYWRLASSRSGQQYSITLRPRRGAHGDVVLTTHFCAHENCGYEHWLSGGPDVSDVADQFSFHYWTAPIFNCMFIIPLDSNF